MSYISPKQRFIQECLADGVDEDDTMFLADLEFDDFGEVRPGSIYECYRKPN